MKYFARERVFVIEFSCEPFDPRFNYLVVKVDAHFNYKLFILLQSMFKGWTNYSNHSSTELYSNLKRDELVACSFFETK